MNRWTVHVKDFGKIEEANVEVAPLTLFVGDNNSGKSYMMTLIYGLLTARFFFDGYDFCEESEAYQECYQVIEKMLTEAHKYIYVLKGEELKSFQNLLNHILKENKKRFLQRLFSRDMDAELIEIIFPKELELEFYITNNLEIGDTPEKFIITQMKNGKSITSGYGTEKSKFKKDEIGYKFFAAYIMQCMLHDEIGQEKKRKRIYFPTARTGFVLTYKTLVGNAMQEKFTLDEMEKNLLTRPVSDFLQELSSLSTVNEVTEYQPVIDFIETHLISGHVNISDAPTQDLLYIPEGSKQKLPLYVTSGVVTEMTPLLLFLKYTEIAALLIEEPEISLHPQLQWQVARVLIQLSNMGLPVFVTTHSDLILQHINNMIKASEMENQDKFLENSDYKETDLLKRKNICVYQFDVQKNHKTNIQKLPCGDYGFEAMTFYDTLQKMNNEIDRIENE